jgi:hypothetical protein
VVLALAAPLNVMVAPLPPNVGVITPDKLNVCAVAVKFNPLRLAPLIVAL